jgi:hypothetical protein
VVRDDASRSALLLQTSDTTWHAYNQYGGNSLYVGSPAGRAYKVSYNRPITTRGTSPEDSFFAAEYPMVRFLEANGYDVSYTSGVDTDRRGALLKNHKAFVSVGTTSTGPGSSAPTSRQHATPGSTSPSSAATRSSGRRAGRPASTARHGAPHARLLQGDEGRRQDRPVRDVDRHVGATPLQPAVDGGGRRTAHRHDLHGQRRHLAQGLIRVPEADGKMRFWRGTAVATSCRGDGDMPQARLGYEWDAELDNGSRPPGSCRLSDATYSISGDYLLDEGDATAAARRTTR